VPILASRALDETFAFYERLGFERRAELPATDAVLVLVRGEIELQFRHTPGLDPFSNGATAYIRVAHPDQLHSEWELTGVHLDRASGSRLIPPVDTGGGGREFALIDLSGNLVRFGSAAESNSGLK
jgi:hypothetical protein